MQFEAVACRLFLHYSYTLAQKASNYGIFCFYYKTKNIEFLDLILINEYICIIFCSLKVYFNGINSNYLVQTGC